MRVGDAYGSLVEFDRPVIETREAAARLGISLTNASRILRSLSDAGLVRRLQRGIWALDPKIDPIAAAPYLTAPFPAYVSLWSALTLHEMIEQIPRSTFVASLDRTKQLATPIGTFSVHHLAPEVFGGFEPGAHGGSVATPEKAIFDVVYMRAPRGGGVYFPELALPASFAPSSLDAWVQRIPSSRLRTLVQRGVEGALTGASRLA